MTATLRDRLRERAQGEPAPARPDPPERLPAWITDATLRYAKGQSLQHIADGIGIASGATVGYWLTKAGVRLRDGYEAAQLRADMNREAPPQITFASRDRLTDWIRRGRDETLDRGIARWAAMSADDLARGGSAFTPGTFPDDP